MSLWLIESNWAKVLFALSSKTDHFVYLVAQVVVLRDTRNRFDFWGPTRLILFPRPLVSPFSFSFWGFCFVFLLFLFPSLLFLFLKLCPAVAVLLDALVSNRVRNGGEESGRLINDSMSTCGRETHVINNRRRYGRRRARQAKTTNQFLLLVSANISNYFFKNQKKKRKRKEN